MSTVSTPAETPLLPEGEVLRLNDWSEPAGWVLAGFAILAGALLIPIPPFGLPGSSGRAYSLLGLAWLCFGLYIAGNTRSGLVVRPDGVTLRGWIRESHHGWAEIESFELKREIWSQALKVKLSDGSAKRVGGFGARSTIERQLAVARVADLNRRVAARR